MGGRLGPTGMQLMTSDILGRLHTRRPGSFLPEKKYVYICCK